MDESLATEVRRSDVDSDPANTFDENAGQGRRRKRDLSAVEAEIAQLEEELSLKAEEKHGKSTLVGLVAYFLEVATVFRKYADPQKDLHF